MFAEKTLFLVLPVLKTSLRLVKPTREGIQRSAYDRESAGRMGNVAPWADTRHGARADGRAPHPTELGWVSAECWAASYRDA